MAASTATASSFQPGDVLVIGGTQQITEYTPDGTIVQAIPIPSNGGGPVEVPHDLTVDDNGIVHVFNGTFSPLLSSYNPASQTWSSTTFPGWNTAGASTQGGVAAFRHFVFATDMYVFPEALNDRGLIRFDLSSNTALKFFNGYDMGDVTVGLDGLVYGVGAQGSAGPISVFDPVSLQLVRTFSLGFQTGGLAVDSAGNIFAIGVGSLATSIARYSPEGTLESTLDTGFDLSHIDIDSQGHIVAASDDHIIITDESLSSFATFQVPFNVPNFSTIVPIPEPGALLEIGVGLAVLSGFRRARQ